MKEIKYDYIDQELLSFIRSYIPTGWTDSISKCCYVPFCWDYYKETGLPWYIKEAVKSFEEKMKGLL